MPFPVVPVIIAGVIGGAIWKKSKKKGMTPERKKIFDAAIKTLRDPVKLRSLAGEFEKEGLKAEGTVLRKRAALFSAPPNVTANRKAVFKKALESKKPEAIKKVASEFHKIGAYESARTLKNYVKGLVTFNKANTKVNGEAEFEGEDVPQSVAEV